MSIPAALGLTIFSFKPSLVFSFSALRAILNFVKKGKSDAPKTMYSPIRSPTTNYHSTGMRNQTEYWSRKTIANYGLLTCRSKGNLFQADIEC